MNRFSIDFSQPRGDMKPMHGVNNGPASSRGSGNAELFTRAGIPYARLHDSAFYAGYGGEHSVDVAALFPCFDADVNDPASYDFTLTDEYLKAIVASGTKIFYRLGSKIEHESKKYGTRVPKSFQKWAEICEHIIRHYNEGWANGLRLGIEYWEIWNEPDCGSIGANPCWQGTEDEFCELFYTAQKHLKSRFPSLKIGGPAFCSVNTAYTEKLLSRLTQNGERVPLDFYSFHGYARSPESYRNPPVQARALLDRFGYTDTEIILNEWNYVRDWQPAGEIRYSYRTIKSLKGAAFIAASLCVSQDTPLNQFMYYDARPSTNWNGLFDIATFEPLKGYYPFLMFNELFKLGRQVCSSVEAPFYGCAASNSVESAALLARYSDVDEAPTEDVLVDMRGLPEKAVVSYELLDETHNLTPVRTDYVYGGRFATALSFPLFSSMLIRVRPA